MAPEALHDLTPAYALDALDDAEERAYEAHLAGCVTVPRGARVAAGGRDVAGLRSRRPRSAGCATRPHPGAGSRRTSQRGPAPAALRPGDPGGRGSSSLRGSRLRRLERPPPARGRQRALSAAGRAQRDRRARDAADQAHRRSRSPVRLPHGLCGARDLAPGSAPSGKTYEAWVVENGKPRPAGTFDAAQSPAVVSLREPVPAGAIVAVTQERGNGGTVPRGPRVLLAQT